MQGSAPVLLPLPRHMESGSDILSLPDQLPLVIANWQQELLPTAERFQRFVTARLGIQVPLTAAIRTGAVCIVVQSKTGNPQGYRLTVTPQQIRIEAGSAAGAAYGLATLKQLMAHYGRKLPTVSIDDQPDFERRGVMLDISRGKVPTMATLCDLIDRLADLKVNEFQLYTEHTFAYTGHEAVWQHYSPMTGEEILALDRYCRERFIDLVPNQNSFGHLKEWLIHEPYKHLAEVEDGWMGWGHWFEGPFSLSPAAPETIPFLAGLYDELLPHFSSRYFNVGCDETLDVGQGKSKELVARDGGHRVYLDQLRKIHRLVKERKRIMQFWGDIIIKAPECIAELPKEIVAMEWGYEANHPFDEHCRQFAAAGVPFYVCPGTSTWLSLAGRTENALGSMQNAARAGLKHGAIGFLNTIWGDRGHQDYQPVTYLPLAFGAAISWCTEANEAVDVKPYLNQFIFGDRTARIGQILSDLGNLYREAGKRPGNASILGLILLDSCDRPQLLDGVTAEDLDHAAAEIRRVARGLTDVELTCADGPLVVAELRNTVRMLLHACELGKLQLQRKAEAAAMPDLVRALLSDLDAIIAEHRQLWLQRNRIGGLMEMSLVPLLKIRSLYTSLL